MPHAATDPGASLNSCAVVAVDVTSAGVWAPVYLAEVTGRRGNPLDLRNVLVPHAREVRRLGCGSWMTDAFALPDVTHAGWDAGLSTVVEGGVMWERWRDACAVASRGLWSFAPHPRLPREMWPLLDVLAEQLATVLESVSGSTRTIVIPTVGASHGDLASAFARALHHASAADVTLDDGGARQRIAADDGLAMAEF